LHPSKNFHLKFVHIYTARPQKSKPKVFFAETLARRLATANRWRVGIRGRPFKNCPHI